MSLSKLGRVVIVLACLLLVAGATNTVANPDGPEAAVESVPLPGGQPPRESGEHQVFQVPDADDYADAIVQQIVANLGDPPLVSDDGDKTDLFLSVWTAVYFLNYGNPYQAPNTIVGPGRSVELPRSWEEIDAVCDWYRNLPELDDGLG